jgi:hypothetical protein
MKAGLAGLQTRTTAKPRLQYMPKYSNQKQDEGIAHSFHEAADTRRFTRTENYAPSHDRVPSNARHSRIEAWRSMPGLSSALLRVEK